MNKNKVIQNILFIAALLVTWVSVSSAQADALAEKPINFLAHVLAFILAFALVVAVIYLRAKDKKS